MSEQKDVSTEFNQDTYQPQYGDLYVLAVHEGRYIIRRYDGVNWEQLGGGHSEQDIKTLIAPMQFLGESKGFRRYYRPTGTEDVSTDYQQRAEQLEQLLRDTLLYIKDKMPYSYESSPRAHTLLDRAAQLGIVPEITKGGE